MFGCRTSNVAEVGGMVGKRVELRCGTGRVGLDRDGDTRFLHLSSGEELACDTVVAAALSMLGAAEPHRAVPWFWSDQHDLSLQIAGLPDAATSEVVRRRADGVDVRVAELLIARRAAPDPCALADASVPLTALLMA